MNHRKSGKVERITESRPHTVLIVDDEPNNLDVLNKCLGSAGYKVLVATTGGMALDRLRRVRPDIVLLDVMMPDMSGYEVCRRITSFAG